jgi:signal transduction histidine kinase
MREADIDQLSHSQGLGLWFVRWVMDTYDGSIEIDSDDGGTRVELGFPA